LERRVERSSAEYVRVSEEAGPGTEGEREGEREGEGEGEGGRGGARPRAWQERSKSRHGGGGAAEDWNL
jgi:hypothetical protein